ELALHVLDAGDLAQHALDVLLDHRAGRATHRRERVVHLDLRPFDLGVVEEPELDDVHPELRVLDLAERLDHFLLRRHGSRVAARHAGPWDFPIAASVTLADLETDPHPVLARLRAHEPVSWLPALGGWLVTSRDLALAVMRDAETFTVDDPRFSTGQVVGKSML